MSSHSVFNYQLIKVASEKYAKAPEQLSCDETEDVERIVQRKMHIEEAVLSSPAASKVPAPEHDVEQAIMEIRKRYRNEEEFEDAVCQRGISRAGLREAVSRELRVATILDYISSDCRPITDVDISLFYYMNTTKFDRPEMRTARHVLITINDNSAENTREAAYKKITQIAARLRKKPSRFEEQALKHSECPTSLQGGLLGEVKRGVLYPELERVLFAMNAGDISGITETELGFHLLRCDEIQLAGTAPLGEVKPKLRLFLEERSRKTKQRQWLDDLLNRTSERPVYGGTING